LVDCRRSTIRVQESPDDVPDQHRPILDAIRAGDPELASRLVIAHCNEAREQVALYFDEPAPS
jgi:DNA-binding GntR family transcriptional regulator